MNKRFMCKLTTPTVLIIVASLIQSILFIKLIADGAKSKSVKVEVKRVDHSVPDHISKLKNNNIFKLDNQIEIEQGYITAGGSMIEAGDYQLISAFVWPFGGSSSGEQFSLDSGFSVTELSCPSVVNISPNTGVVGSQVSIFGSNLGYVSTVYFPNNIVATILSSSNNELVVRVPSGTLTGPITIISSAASCIPITTGIFTVIAQYSFGGYIRYALNSNKNISGATVTAMQQNTPVRTSVTNSTGYYELSQLQSQPYNISSSKSGDINGISAFDASIVARGGLRISDLVTAADVDGNSKVDTNDADLILKFVVGLQDARSRVGQWRIDSSEGSSFIYYPPNLVSSNKDFKAYLLGDVTDNWSPFAAPTINNIIMPDGFNEKRWKVVGTGFSSDMQVNIILPDGGQLTIPGSVIDEITAQSFFLKLPHIMSGVLRISVINLAGRASATYSLITN